MGYAECVEYLVNIRGQWSVVGCINIDHGAKPLKTAKNWLDVAEVR